MDGVKDYWKNPLFLVGMFLCVVGTLAAITGEHHIGVWSELAGFGIIVLSIFLMNKNSEEKVH
jgi:hypothetical protein